MLLLVMGDLPAEDNMVSTIITFPSPGQDIEPNETFDITLQVDNLVAGFFTNPNTAYYTAPQILVNGIIQGHVHVVVQSMNGDINAKTPFKATEFDFFKGVNNRGDGNGGLRATVPGGLKSGVFRVCTMASATNHQPVIMPVSLSASSVSFCLLT